MDEPKDELAERRAAKEKDAEAQYFCGECGFGIFHLTADGSVYCASCGMQSENIAVVEQRLH